jgi:hypothetical protein
MGGTAKRSGERIDDYSSEYFQSSLRYIDNYEFTNKVFASNPAEAWPEGWIQHEHCCVCLWRITDGDSYWENPLGRLLCDECHDFVMADPAHGIR